MLRTSDHKYPRSQKDQYMSTISSHFSQLIGSHFIKDLNVRNVGIILKCRTNVGILLKFMRHKTCRTTEMPADVIITRLLKNVPLLQVA